MYFSPSSWLAKIDDHLATLPDNGQRILFIQERIEQVERAAPYANERCSAFHLDELIQTLNNRLEACRAEARRQIANAESAPGYGQVLAAERARAA